VSTRLCRVCEARGGTAARWTFPVRWPPDWLDETMVSTEAAQIVWTCADHVRSTNWPASLLAALMVPVPDPLVSRS
jgi:hypothetical protein